MKRKHDWKKIINESTDTKKRKILTEKQLKRIYDADK